MTNTEFIEKWNIAFENKEQKEEFAKEMRKDLNSIEIANLEELKEDFNGVNPEFIPKIINGKIDYIKNPNI